MRIPGAPNPAVMIESNSNRASDLAHSIHEPRALLGCHVRELLIREGFLLHAVWRWVVL